MIKDRITWPRLTILVALFLLLWIAAWIVHNQVVAPGFHLVAGSVADTVYWMIAKLLVWVVFPFLFVAQPLWKQATLIGLQAKYLRRDLIFGAGAAAFWLILSALRFFLTDQHFALTMSAFIAFYTVILTPLSEEIMFRGYIQSTLAALKTPFVLADVVGDNGALSRSSLYRLELSGSTGGQSHIRRYRHNCHHKPVIRLRSLCLKFSCGEYALAHGQ